MNRPTLHPLFYWLLGIAGALGILLVAGIAFWLFHKGAPIIAPIVVRPRSNGQRHPWHRLFQRVVEKAFGLETEASRTASLPRRRDGPRERP